MSPRIRSLLLRIGPIGALLALLLGGCGTMWIDAEGIGHAVGIGHVRFTTPRAATGGESLGVHSLGLSMSHSEAGMALSLGYSDTTFSFVRDDSCVLPAALRAAWPLTDQGASHAFIHPDR